MANARNVCQLKQLLLSCNPTAVPIVERMYSYRSNEGRRKPSRPDEAKIVLLTRQSYGALDLHLFRIAF